MAHPEWVDTHGHLFLLEDEPSATLARASDAGVAWVMCPGIDVATSEASREIARAHPGTVKWSAGLHPHEASSWPDAADRIAELAEDADALGECGLDYYRNLAPRDHQIAAFVAQLGLASDLGKPIIVHCRDAFADVYGALERAALGERAVLHCWTGGPKWTKRFRELGATFSFAGPLTYPTGDTLRLAAAEAPHDATMVETDAPYLTPQARRPEPNEPAYVPYTGSALADVWGLEAVEAARLTTATAERVFGVPVGR